MIKKHSDDPDVAKAASIAAEIVKNTLASLGTADTFDYGGHEMHIGEYDVCQTCTRPIAEAQAAEAALRAVSEKEENDTVRAHIEEAIKLFKLEAEVAQVRAELHNGENTEAILNAALGHIYERKIFDEYHHSHTGGN
jgi:hypothetical protein